MTVLKMKEIDVHLLGSEPVKSEQKQFMEVCLECFLEGKNGMLELSNASPRSAALLSTSLSWLLHNPSAAFTAKQVLFLCGTEQELLNTVEEFKKSFYASKNLHMIVMNYSEDLKAHFFQSCCSKNEFEKKITVPTIIFCTQELFFHELTLSILSPSYYDFQSTIVLVDDAFRVEEACCPSSSLSLCKVDQLIKELQDVQDSEEIISKLEGVKKVFRCIAPHRGSQYDPVYTGAEISLVLDHCGAVFKEPDVLFLKEQKNLDLQKLLYFMSLVELFTRHGSKTEYSHVISELIKNNPKAVNMYVTESSSKAKTKNSHLQTCQVSCKTLHFICLDSSILFRTLTNHIKPHSILLSSATISPLGRLKTELGCLEAREFIGKCSIEDYQLFARVVDCGSGGQFLVPTNSKCLDLDYQTSVGKTILSVAKVTPAGQGMTVYFSSDDMFMQFKKHWTVESKEKSSLWKQICQEKEIVSPCNIDDLKLYRTHAGLKKGHCIFAILQKEELEELIHNSVNLNCHHTVLIIGVPSPSEVDPKVALKKKYNQEISETGDLFIQREAYKCVRKILDHTLQSVHDYGVILLCDTNYIISELSPWIKGKVLREKRFSEMLHEMHDFFENVEKRIQWKKAKEENAKHSNNEFGHVKVWEMENVRLELLKLKKNNNHLEKDLDCRRNDLKVRDTEIERLKGELKELSEKSNEKPQCPDMQPKAGKGSPVQIKQESRAEISPSPIKSGLTPRKRPQCPDMQSADKVGGESIVQHVRSTKLSPSPKKKPYPENF